MSLYAPPPMITTTDNPQTQPSIERHIMISYKHEPSSDVCQKICHRLRVNMNELIYIDVPL